MKNNVIVSFSGRKEGNCDTIAKYISTEIIPDQDSLLLYMREIAVQPCACCNYECMSGQCKYHGDGIYPFFQKLALADRIFFIIPMYCGNPSALYFMMNERSQAYFMQNENHYQDIVEKLYIIGVYGNAQDDPGFLDTFARQYDFENPRKHILGLERHRYHQKMEDFLLDEADVRVRLHEFVSGCTD